jgi:dienelactone hydrolase
MQTVMTLFNITPGHTNYDDVATIPAATMDARRALRWMRSNSEAWGIDPDRIGAMGVSAGAVLAMILGSMGDEPSLEFDRLNPGDPIPHPDQSSHSRVSIDHWGTLLYFSGIIEAHHAPMMIVHGTADPVIPYSQAVTIRDRCVEVGLPHEFWPVAGGGHGFQFTSFDLNGATLGQRTLDFIRLHLGLLPATPTPTPTVSFTPTVSPTPTISPTGSAVPTDSPSPSPTFFPTPSVSATPTRTPQVNPSVSPSPTPSPSPTSAATLTASITPNRAVDWEIYR